MRSTLIIFLLAVIPMIGFSQEATDSPLLYQRPFNPFYMNSGLSDRMDNTTPSEIKKTDVGVQIGTSFATDFNKGFSFTTYASPELRYRVNKRFQIRGGISIANTEYGNTLVYSPYGFSRYSGNITQGTLYVSGDYVISPKVVLSGTAYKEFSIDNGNPNDIFSPAYDGKGLMMNLRISPRENMFIDVGAEFYQGNNPYRNGYFSPFRNNPMMW